MKKILFILLFVVGCKNTDTTTVHGSLNCDCIKSHTETHMETVNNGGMPMGGNLYLRTETVCDVKLCDTVFFTLDSCWNEHVIRISDKIEVKR